MKTLLIRGGHVVDPAQNIDRPADVLIADDQIAGVGEPGSFGGADQVLDAKNLLVMPGLIDMSVHLREPGLEKAETIITGARAAVAGGFATIICTSDTDPPVDNEASAEYIFLQAQRANLANVYPMGTITKQRKGEFLAEIGQLSKAGTVAFSDADRPVSNAGVFAKALRYCSMFDKPVIQPPIEPSLASGVMHAGYHAARLGMPGISASAEEVSIARDVILAREANAHLHVAHISTRGSVELIRRAKKDGTKVTCSVTPHHLILTDEIVQQFDANGAKVMPPLRSPEHVEALVQGIVEGTIDVISSNHEPHPAEDTALDFVSAPFGMVGLETAVALIHTHFIVTGRFSRRRLVELMCVKPAEILRLPSKRSLEKGSDADVTIFDPTAKWTVDPDKFHSKSKNTAFAGRELTGRARYTIVMGRLYDTAVL